LNLRVNANATGEAVWSQFVSGNYFTVLQAPAVIGRTLLPEDEQQASPVAVVSDSLWQRRFGGDRSILNQRVLLNGQPVTIIGVAPPRFNGSIVGLAFDLWTPVTMSPVLLPGKNDINARGDRWMQGLARLKNDVSLEQSRSEILTLSQQLSRNDGESPALGIVVQRLRDQLAGRLLTPLFSVLLIISGIVLLTACANVANLLLAQATSRQKEIGVRLALGAVRWRLLRQLLTESLLLALVAGVVGLLVAYVSRNIFLALLPPVALPLHFSIEFTAGVIGFALLLTVVTAVVFGLVPALRATRPDLIAILKNSERGLGAGGSKLRSSLVVIQVALSLCAIVSAGLFIRSLQQARALSLGFTNPNQILVVTTDLNLARLTPETGSTTIEQLRQRIKALPGVQGAAFTSMTPLGFGGHNYSKTEISGYTPSINEELSIKRVIITPDYFSTLQIPIVKGRAIFDQDLADAMRVAVVNEAFAERYWPNQDPLGKQLDQGFGPTTVVGVAKNSAVRDLGEVTPPLVYTALTQRYTPNLFLQIRTDQPKMLTESVRREFTAINPDLPFLDPRTLAESQTAASFVQFIGATMLSAFGLLSLSLASVGLYGMLAFVVSQRQRELAIRMALGAQTGDIRRLVFKQGFTLLAVGLLVGGALSLAAARLFQSQLLGISPNDPLTLITGVAVLAFVALVACYGPARRAIKADPIMLLRNE
jgi:putative ABC transport system permease protein